MTNLVSRILLAILLIPLSAILYCCLGVVLSDRLRSEFAILWTHIFVGAFIVLYWLVLWHRSVLWTGWRKGMTLLAGVGCLAAGAVSGLFIIARIPYGREPAIFMGGLLAIVLWLVVSVLLWRETAAERAERIRQAGGEVLFCPRCGYNMTGLYESRCPECGTRLTLDQLYAAQRRPGLEETGVPGDQAAK